MPYLPQTNFLVRFKQLDNACSNVRFINSCWKADRNCDHKSAGRAMMTAGTLLHLCPWAKSMAAGELILSPKCDAYAKHNPQKTFPDALKDNLNRRSYADADKKQPPVADLCREDHAGPCPETPEGIVGMKRNAEWPGCRRPRIGPCVQTLVGSRKGRAGLDADQIRKAAAASVDIARSAVQQLHYVADVSVSSQPILLFRKRRPSTNKLACSLLSLP